MADEATDRDREPLAGSTSGGSVHGSQERDCADLASHSAANGTRSFDRAKEICPSALYAITNSRTGPTTNSKEGSGTFVNVNCPLNTKPANSESYGRMVVPGPSVGAFPTRNPARLSSICPLRLAEP